MSAEHTYKFNVSMSCGGCSGAVNRVLGKLDGVCLSLLPPTIFPSALQPSTQCLSHMLTILSTGVKSYDVSLDTQTATVVAEPNLAYETVLKTIAKTGKKINSGEVDGESKSIEVLAE
jgi:copper chaperone